MRRDLVGIGFEKARARTQARITATILDLEREMPTIRACALQHWQAATAALSLEPGDRRAVAAEAATFWDWALVELLVQSGLRIEEASELTTLDILKHQLPDGRLYYLFTPPTSPTGWTCSRQTTARSSPRLATRSARQTSSTVCSRSPPAN